MRRIYKIILFFALLAVISLVVYEFVRPPMTPNGSNGSEIIFENVEGGEVTVEGLLSQGKPLVIYFFATWCPVCRNDLKALDEVYREGGASFNVLVVGFDPSETREQIKSYKDENKYVWIFAEYNKDAITKYKVVTQSSKVGISKDGEVKFSEGYGVLSNIEWVEILQQLTP